MATNPFIKARLFCPGPTPVPLEAAAAQLNSTVYHRTEEFNNEFLRARKLLAPFFGSRSLPLILACSGTGAMEAAVLNLTDPGDQVVCVNAGKFGQRWESLNTTYGCHVHSLKVPWGKTPDIKDLVKLVESTKSLKAIFLQANETSTGAAFPLRDIAKALRKKTDALIVVDAISALVAHDIRMDEWGLDCVVAGSQKGLGIPPGLGFITLSDKAATHISKRPKYYFDLKKEAKNQEQGASAYTPATTLVLALGAALTKLSTIGVKDCIAHHARLARATQAAARALGLELFAHEHPSNALTAIALPASIDGGRLVKVMRTQYGAIAAGGQDQLKGKIIRLAHLGFVDQLDLISGIAAFEFGLRAVGYQFKLGSGVTAAMESLQSLV